MEPFKDRVLPYALDEFGVKTPFLGDNVFGGALVAITPEHHEIHCADSYVVSTVTAATNQNSSHYVLITVPAPTNTAKRFHMDFTLTSGASTAIGEGQFYLYEAPTLTGTPAGTTLTPINRNRDLESNITFPPELSFLYDPTNVTDGTGTLLYTSKTGSNRLGISGRGGEWPLKNNTRYYLKWTSNTGSCIASIEINYYIHSGI